MTYPAREMYTPADRERIRSEIVTRAKADPRITGGALTGSGSVGKEDAFSDIDLAFGVPTAADVRSAVEAYSEYMHATHGAVDHLDVPSGAWIYRVFLLPNTLQVDLAFAPKSDFGARHATFRLLFGESAQLPYVAPPVANALVGWAWLYALHVRSALARGKLWQAEYMLHGMRDQVFALACLRHGENPRDGRGMDSLPNDVRTLFEPALVRSLEPDAIGRAFDATTRLAVAEARHIDATLARRIEPVMIALTKSWGGTRPD